MAYFDTFEDEKKREDEQGAEKVIAQRGNEIASSNMGGDNAGGGQGQSATDGKQKGTGFTNLNTYVQANTGNDAAMGQRLQSKVGGDIQKANETASGFQKQTQKQIQDNTVKDQNVIESLKKNPMAVDKDQFKKQYMATYGGPQGAADVEGYQDVAKNYGKIAENQNVNEDFNARQRLLQDTYDKGDYSSGEQKLDSFILGAGNQGAKALQDIAQSTRQAGTGWEDMLASINNQAAQAADITNKTRENTAQAYQNAVGGLDDTFKALKAQADADAAKGSSQFSKLESQLGSQYFNNRKKAYEELGIDPQLGEFLKNQGYDLTNLTDATSFKGLGDLAKAGDIAKYEALLGLTDANSDFDFSKTGASGDYYNLAKDQLGAAKSYQNLFGDLQQRQKEKETEYELLKAALEGSSSSLVNPLTAMGIDSNAVQTLKSSGIDPTQFLTKNKVDALGLATASEQKKWGKLMNELGLSNKLGKSGSVYDFDKEGLMAALNAPAISTAAQQASTASKDSLEQSTGESAKQGAQKAKDKSIQVAKDTSPGQVKKKITKKLGF